MRYERQTWGSDANCTRFFDLFVAMCNHVDDIVDISWVSSVSRYGESDVIQQQQISQDYLA